MYSLIRSLIGANEARMLIHDRVVVRRTRMSDSPSTPTLYWIPKSGIHWSVSLYWKARASATADAPGSKPMTSRSETTHAARLAARARVRA